MKRTEHIIPFVDIIFQTLGVLIVSMTVLEHVESIPVDLARVSKQVKVSQKAQDSVFVAIRRDGIYVGKEKINSNSLIPERIKGKDVILRVDKNIPYGEVVGVISGIRDHAAKLSLEVDKDG